MPLKKKNTQKKRFKWGIWFVIEQNSNDFRLPHTNSTGSMRTFSIFVILLGALWNCQAQNRAGYDLSALRLKNYAAFRVGAAVSPSHIQNDSLYTQTLVNEFNQITATNHMKMYHIWKSPDSMSFSKADFLVNFAEAHHMKVHGHTLLWHYGLPEWIAQYPGDSAAFEALIRDYIHTVVGRYKGRIKSWDVVNEAFGEETGTLRPGTFLSRMGPDYIARCFVYAHQADPDALLFYNDFGMEYDSLKLSAVIAMVNDFRKRGIPIHGIGLQCHTQIGYASYAGFRRMFDECAKTGLLVHISELDVTVNGNMEDNKGKATAFDPDLALAQKERVRFVVDCYTHLPAECRFAITTWGVSDKDSWLRNWAGPKNEWPLLFDDTYQRKPCYYGFLEGLGYKADSNTDISPGKKPRKRNIQNNLYH